MLISCLSLGMTVKDFEMFDIGELFDIIITNNNILYEAQDEKENDVTIRNATQSDFDSF